MPDIEAIEARRWAVEQAIKIHGANGSTLAVVIADAARLVEWIETGAPAHEAASQ